ncbi:MAG: hypothetical protein JSW73_02970 [Candidatus Woesearchaeota archaeon]|nr:MAG: hypothetical protein JSW73_02970 [Candidatus Woesearchaeota archaeon]
MKLKVNPPYKPLVQMHVCCGVCSFLWVLHRRGYWIDQEEIAQACNLYILKKTANLFKLKMKITKSAKKEGVNFDKFHKDANKLLKKKKIPLKMEKYSISQIEDPKKFIIKHLKSGEDVMVNFACKALQLTCPSAHICVIAEFDTKNNILTLGDSSWTRPKYWKVKLDKMVKAMDKKHDGRERGFWVISEK